MATVMPDVTLDEEAKKLLAWLMYETKKDASAVIKILGRHYHQQRKGGRTLFNLHEILKLRELCQDAEIDPAEIQACLKYMAKLERLGLAVEDLPHLSEAAESMAQAGISYEQCERNLALREKLEEAEIKFDDLEQLKETIDVVNELTELPEKKVRELASLVTKTDEAKEHLQFLQTQVKRAKKNLDALKAEKSILEEDKVAAQQEITQLTSEIYQLEGKVALLEQNISKQLTTIQGNQRTIQIVNAFRDLLLSREVLKSHPFWSFLREIIIKKEKQNSLLAPAPKELIDGLREEIIVLLRELAGEEILGKFELDRIKKERDTRACENLRDKHASIIAKSENGFKKVLEGMEEVKEAQKEFGSFKMHVELPRTYGPVTQD